MSFWKPAEEEQPSPQPESRYKVTIQNADGKVVKEIILHGEWEWNGDAVEGTTPTGKAISVNVGASFFFLVEEQ